MAGVIPPMLIMDEIKLDWTNNWALNITSKMDLTFGGGDGMSFPPDDDDDGADPCQKR